MTGHLLHGNSMDDYPLTLTSIVERAERFHADREVVSRRPSGAVTRTTLGGHVLVAPADLPVRWRRSASVRETRSPRCCGRSTTQ